MSFVRSKKLIVAPTIQRVSNLKMPVKFSHRIRVYGPLQAARRLRRRQSLSAEIHFGYQQNSQSGQSLVKRGAKFQHNLKLR